MSAHDKTPPQEKSAEKPEENYGIRILKDGVWLYNGTPITRHNLVKLFASVLTRDENGDYWLITPAERGRIDVEDAPFIAVEMTAEGAGAAQVLRFRTNLDDWVVLDSEHPLRVVQQDGSPAPYIHVRGGMEAKIARPVYYDLARMAVPSPTAPGIMGVYSSGDFYSLGQTA